MLNPGDSVQVDDKKTGVHTVKNVDDTTWTCTCLGWKFSRGTTSRKTCKHLRQVRGVDAEAARISGFSSRDEKPEIPVTKQGPKPQEKVKIRPPSLLFPRPLSDFPDLDLSGWWFSEKHEGVRSYWDGKQLVSTQGTVFMVPKWFVEDFPDHPVDGVLWAGRGLSRRMSEILKQQDTEDGWETVEFVALDLPHIKDSAFEKRQEMLEDSWRRSKSSYFKLHFNDVIKSNDHFQCERQRMVSIGADGMMVRQPGSQYEKGKSSYLLEIDFDKHASVSNPIQSVIP